MRHGLIALAMVSGSLLLSRPVFSEEAKPQDSVPLQEIPKPDEPKAEVPKAEPIKTEAPKAEEPKAVKAEETPASKPAPGAAKTDPKPMKAVGCVSPLQDLIKFYEKEIVSTRKTMDRWGAKLQVNLDRQKEIDDELSSLAKDLEEKKADPKRNKKEIARVGKQMERLQKDRKGLAKQMDKQCAELAGEVKDMGKESAAVLKERFQQIYKEIEGE